MTFRVAARHATGAPATLRADTQREVPVELVDVGLHGARIVVDDPPVEGAVVRLTVHPEVRWAPIVLDAVVRWHRGDLGPRPEVGLEFGPLTPETALAMARWLVGLPLVTPSSRPSPG